MLFLKLLSMVYSCSHITAIRLHRIQLRFVFGCCVTRQCAFRLRNSPVSFVLRNSPVSFVCVPESPVSFVCVSRQSFRLRNSPVVSCVLILLLLLISLFAFRIACRIACRFSLVAYRLSLFACRLSLVACRLSLFACHLSLVACHLLLFACRLSLVVCHLSLVPCRFSLFACRFSLGLLLRFSLRLSLVASLGSSLLVPIRPLQMPVKLPHIEEVFPLLWKWPAQGVSIRPCCVAIASSARDRFRIQFIKGIERASAVPLNCGGQSTLMVAAMISLLGVP